MSSLGDIVAINRRFARSARLDVDLNGSPPLVGYVLQASVAKSLTVLADSQIESRQGAFTWTGPYGGGKSSAALLVANLVGGAPENRAIAQAIAGPDLVTLYERAFPDRDGPWAVVPVTGSRIDLRAAVVAGCANALGWSEEDRARALASDANLVQALLAVAGEGRGGVLLVLDELGKLLEHAAATGGDVHLLQDLAEHSARSAGRLVVIGILHQAFDQYATRVAHDARQEWAKVQGRFQDLSFLAGADETVALLGRAISCADPPPSAERWAQEVAEAVARRRPTETAVLADALRATWPLNPVTALLLGPVSRQRFAQNERSVFGFLSSAETAGFQDHLRTVSTDTERVTYDPDRLWDYLAANFGMALASGPDGGRYSLAFEAIDRAAAKGGPLHVAVTKAAAMIEFFRNGSGLALADDVLGAALPYASAPALRAVVEDLLQWAILIRQPRLGGYALFAGSDFDLEDAIGRAMGPLDPDQLAATPQRVGLGFAVAKRHYFRTGALRTFDVVLQTVSRGDATQDLADKLSRRASKRAGCLVLLFSDGSLDMPEVEGRSRDLTRALAGQGVVAAVAGASNSYLLRAHAAELFAVERVLRESPQLQGDRIARRESAARHSACVDAVHRELETALESAKWWLTCDPRASVREPLAIVASALADKAFHHAPVLKSELLQRERPSSNAMAALRDLCHAMVERADQPDLGFHGFPAEMGLYLTTLRPFGLHSEVRPGEFDFCGPCDEGDGPSLKPAWAVLDRDQDVTLGEVYRTWAQPPYGLKAGVMPVLALANIMARRDSLAVYVDGVFQTALDAVFADKLLQKPDGIRLRRIDRSARETAFLHGLARSLGLMDGAAALPVAQALYRRYEALPTYARRTETLSAIGRKVRGVVLHARDPEALLFQHLPEALDDALAPGVVHAALVEAEGVYGAMLDALRRALARALGVDPATFEGVASRAGTIKDLTNDFAFEAFAMRAAAFDREGASGDIEGLASLLLHKPPRNWSDRDREQALLEMARLGRRFRELEALAVVRDRRTSSEALALVVGVDAATPPVLRSFELSENERAVAAALADRLLTVLGEDRNLNRVQLAALARAVASLAADVDTDANAQDVEAA